jgi:hypothetical protein
LAGAEGWADPPPQLVDHGADNAVGATVCARVAPQAL